MIFKGDHLNDVQAMCIRYLDSLKQMNEEDMSIVKIVVQQAALSLSGLTKDPTSFEDESFNEFEYIKKLDQDGKKYPLCVYYTCKLFVLFQFGNYTDALEIGEKLQKYMNHSVGKSYVSFYNLYYSLTMASLYPRSTEQVKYLSILKTNQKKMKKWSSDYPENILHKYLLIAAEIARITGEDQLAIELYGRAIKSARENEYIQNEALAYELAALHHITNGREESARTYLLEARSCYDKWGAVAKVKYFDEKYSQFLSCSIETSGKSEYKSTSELSIMKVVKALQKLSGEIYLNKLLDRLMRIVIKYTGAQKGFLLLERENELFIEAESVMDHIVVLQSTPVESSQALSSAIVSYVKRTNKDVILNDAMNKGKFTSDSYIIRNQSKSILCLPITKQSKLKAILYLENNQKMNAFDAEKLNVLSLLSSQVAISLENAQIFNELKQHMKERTVKLSETNTNLLKQIKKSTKIEDALILERYFFSTLMDNIPDAIYFKDINSCFIRISKAHAKLFGLSSADEAIGRTDFDFFKEEHAQIASEDEIEVMKSGKPLIGKEEKEVWPDGKVTWSLTSKMPLLDKKGKIIGTFGISRDITKIKHVEEELRKHADALERSNQELHQFAYVASHDLQEPLRMIGSYTQLLERRYKNKLDSNADEFIDFVLGGVKRMQTLIKDLLKFSRIGTQGKQFKSTDSAAVLEMKLLDLKIAIEESNAVVTYDQLPIVNADDVQLGQLFQNLIGNAIKFRNDCLPKIHISAKRNNNQWIFSIEDNGIGIEKQYKDQIFEIFQRLHTNEEYSGTGIGLAICKKIVERHGGKIWLESELGKGTTFYFNILASV